MRIENFEGKMDQGWIDKLSPFLISEEFDNIITELRREKELGFVVCPDVQYLFRAFKECKYNDLRCIIVGQDPYFTSGQADGVAMSCSLTGVLQPSLKMFYDEINKTVYEGTIDPATYNPSLDYLAQQGVLLINAAMTVREKEPRSHLGLWKPFMEYLFLEVINSYQRGLPIVILGAEASKAIEPSIAPFTHYTFTTEHPAYAARQNRDWNCNNVFNLVNNILLANNGKEFVIDWMNKKNGKEEA
jgi:uracil-DNA glycosylase